MEDARKNGAQTLPRSSYRRLNCHALDSSLLERDQAMIPRCTYSVNNGLIEVFKSRLTDIDACTERTEAEAGLMSITRTEGTSLRAMLVSQHGYT